MVAMKDVRSMVETYFDNRPLVAVLIGATSGIGEYCIRALAQQYAAKGSNLRIYFVGRSQGAANNIITDCSKICPGGEFIFVKASDLTSLHDVDRVSWGILKSEEEARQPRTPRIDLLLMTQGQVLFGPRQETTEGLDRTMALLYYSRIRFVTNLMPLLEQGPTSSRVISVYAAGLEGKIFRNDLSLRDSQHYSFANARSHIVHMTTVAFERLAEKHPGLSLVHIFPGIVITPGYKDPSLPMWFKAIWRIFGPAVEFMKGIPPADAALRMLYPTTQHFPAKQDHEQTSSGLSKGTNGQMGSGAYAVGEDSEVVDVEAKYAKLRDRGFFDKVWDHTQTAFKSISEGHKFTG